MQLRDRRQSVSPKPKLLRQTKVAESRSSLESLLLVPFFLVVIAWILKWLGRW